MSDHEDDTSQAGYHDTDHQSAYVYIPGNAVDIEPTRPTKKHKLGNQKSFAEQRPNPTTSKFDALLNGKETLECLQRRYELYDLAWSHTESQIKSILDEANEGTLRNVTTFLRDSSSERLGRARTEKIVPTGFIVTGPNIASQGLLFEQLSAHLRAEINGPAVVLLSGDASNLKGILKKVIRDATNQKTSLDEDDEISTGSSGPKLLNYDLELLHAFVRTHGSQAVVVAFQDSEAFDTSLIADLVSLFSSWIDRIPFVLLFGIATSLDLFQERLPRIASRSLQGAQFDVEQTSSLVERIFKKVLAGGRAPLRLSTSLVASLVERQQEHAQSVQSFTAALKYAYMCHFFANPLSIFTPVLGHFQHSDLLLVEHYEAVRTLPSFKNLVKHLVEAQDFAHIDGLLEDNTVLLDAIESSLLDQPVILLLRVMHLIATLSPEPVSSIELYMSTFDGSLSESDFVGRILDSTKRMTPDELLLFLQKILDAVQNGSSEMDLENWAEEHAEFLEEITSLQSQASELAGQASETGKPVRSSYAIRSQGVRTTVIAQRVQLSYEDSTLSEQDKTYTTLVDKLNNSLKEYFSVRSPQDMFLHEVWLYDSMLPYRDVFTPKPRAAIERALSAPFDYLQCDCCESVEGLSSTHPATAILYQMYLETGSLINVFDLWSAFFEMISGGDEQKINERDALVLFYRALADLKSLGMIKHSKKKADHLGKTTWKGL